MLKSIKLFGTLALLGAMAPARAAVIDLAPVPSLLNQYMAANIPIVNAVRTGVGESFKASDPNVLAGFYLFNPSIFSLSSSPVEYRLYDGDGVGGSLLATKPVAVSLGALSSGLVTADFSSVTLTVGHTYTLIASLTGMALPSMNNTSPVAVLFSNLIGNPGTYTDGRAWYAGSTEVVPSFWDMALHVQGAVAPVPLPASSWLLLSGVLGLALWSRRRPSGLVA